MIGDFEECVRSTHGLEPVASAISFQLWELCSGSSVLSAATRERGITHLPPINFRYGWSLGRAFDQVIVMWCLLQIGVGTFFMSPQCSPWGANSRGCPPGVKARDRAAQHDTLQLLAMCCLV